MGLWWGGFDIELLAALAHGEGWLRLWLRL